MIVKTDLFSVLEEEYAGGGRHFGGKTSDTDFILSLFSLRSPNVADNRVSSCDL